MLNMPQTTPRHQSEIRVIYGDTDQLGMVYYGRYLEYFERARGELLRSVGLVYRELEVAGLYLPVTHCRIDYRAPARYDDLLQLSCWAERESHWRLRLRLPVTIHCGETLICEGYTEHLVTDGQGRPLRPRGAQARLLATLTERLFAEGR